MKKYDDHFESEYNLRARHPDFETYFERWQNESEQARSTLPCSLDQRYGDGPNMSLDIFPQPGASHPILLFIHGGYWRSLDKESFNYPAIGLSKAGVVYISINYALAPMISLDEIVGQCRQAVTWVHRNAKTFGGDPNRIHISGHSAGGHLTAMMLSTNWAQQGELEIKLAGGIAISGLFDLVPILKTSINNEVQLDMTSARRNSPSGFLPASGAPFIAAVGGNETDEFLRQSRDYAAAWNEHSGDGQYLPLAKFHHFDVVCELGRSGSELNDAILAQIGA